MATWLYVFLFPKQGDKLRSEGVKKILKSYDINFRDEITPCELTAEGFYIAADDKSIKINNENFDEIRERFVQEKINFQLEFTGHELYGNITWLTFTKQENSNPHVIISFPLNRYYEKILEGKKQDLYRRILIDVAKSINASYLLFTEEATENFQDCFLEREDGVRLLDAALLLQNPWPYIVSEIWVDYTNGAKTPLGFPLHEKKALSKGFFKHHANYTAMNRKRWCSVCGYDTLI